MKRLWVAALLLTGCGAILWLWWRSQDDAEPLRWTTADGGTRASEGLAQQFGPWPTAARSHVREQEELGVGQAVTSDAAEPLDAAASNEARARVEAWLDDNASEATRAVEGFCAIANKVQRPRERGPSGNTRDAQVFMTGKMDSEGVPPFVGALHLSEVLVDELSSLHDDWFLGIRPRHLEGLDFSWMAALHEFDVWRGPAIDASAVPNYARMKWWVVLRLAAGRLNGDFEGAWIDVEQFCRLLRSQGNLVAEITSYQFMELAEKARVQAQKIGLRVPDNGIDYGELRALSRAAPAFLYPRVPSAVAKRALKCFPPLCGGLAEAAELQRVMASFGAAPELDLSACPSVAERAVRLVPLPPSQALDYVSDDTPLRRFAR